jgi:hypothetical protein
VDESFVDDEGRRYVPSSTDALDNCNLLTIAWLNNLWLSMLFCTRNDLY